jgi:hypothetical protein
VGQQGQVLPFRTVEGVVRSKTDDTELYEVVSATAGPQLGRGLGPQFLGHGQEAEGFVFQYGMIPGLVVGPESKGSVLQQNIGKARLVLFRQLSRQIKNRETHPATDVYAHSVGNHATFGGQYPANGQSVPVMRIGHQGTGHGDGQSHGVVQLLDGVGRNTGLRVENGEVSGRFANLRVDDVSFLQFRLPAQG